MTYYSQIIGTGSHFPTTVMHNKEFETFLDTSDEWIRARTGIVTRRIADQRKGESTLSLSYEASRKALEMAGLSGQTLDLIVVGTVTPESIMPTTANSLQAKLGACNAFSFDLQAACSGFLYALSIADLHIRSGKIKKALVVGAETLSTIVNWQDRGTCILFGDGAGAVVLNRSETPEHAILATRLYSDGTKGPQLCVPHGYSAMPNYMPEYKRSEQAIKMAGQEIFKLAVHGMVESSHQVLQEAGVALGEVSYFLFHQANIRIIDMCLKTLKIPREKTWLNIDKYGNTSAATLPVALDEAWKAGKVKPGDLILMATFGGGVTWAASLIRL